MARAKQSAADALRAISGRIAIVTAENGVNVRKGPGTIFESIGAVEWREPVAVLQLPYDAEVPGYALVHTGTLVGWVCDLFLQDVETGA